MKIISIAMVLFLGLVSGLQAQGKKYAVKINKIEIKSLNSPVFTDRIINENVPVKKWGVILAEYEVKFADIKARKGALDDGKWLDDVEVKWEFLHKPKDAKSVEAIGRFGRTVKYTSVGEGKHRVAIFINPTQLKRYFKGGTEFNNIWLRFSMKVNGLRVQDATTVYAEKKKVEGKELANYTRIFNDDRTRLMKNMLLRRDETPFRSIQSDAFNVINSEAYSERNLSLR